ncbi:MULTISPECIES: hypothetical protein [unclassified Nocardioides]|uniref:hypothetical protein n=1 Tax=unclassified Nocardioides TaxID=2615069 RepID=UPI00361A8100
MNAFTTRAILATAAAAICLAGTLIGASAQATTDTSCGSGSASRELGIEEIVALRKAQMARYYYELNH